MEKRGNVSYKKTKETDNFRRLSWTLGTLFFFMVFIIFFVIGDYGLYQIYLLNREKTQVREHIKTMHQEHDSLQAEIQRLETDIDYIEKLARERYRMARKGEKVFRVIDRTVEGKN